MSKTIDIVFDGPPGPQSSRFVEVERDGRSIKLGEWVERPDGYWVLRIPDPEALLGGKDILALETLGAPQNGWEQAQAAVKEFPSATILYPAVESLELTYKEVVFWSHTASGRARVHIQPAPLATKT